MNRHRNSSQQQPHHCHRHHHRYRPPTEQEIHILMDKSTSQFQFSIKSNGPINTTVVVDPAVLTYNSSTSPSSPLPTPSPHHTTFSSSGWNTPLIRTVADLPPPPPPPPS